MERIILACVLPYFSYPRLPKLVILEKFTKIIVFVIFTRERAAINCGKAGNYQNFSIVGVSVKNFR